jgi:membrane-bound serine protease (ClpP class)
MSRRTWISIWMLCMLLLTAFGQPAQAQSSSPIIIVLQAEGPVMPPMKEYIARGIRLAEKEKAEALILQLDTPGGSLATMNQIVENIRGSYVPVIVYVAPRGAMAASAGTIIVLAGHAAAMAPETTIGAASPVGSSGEDLNQTMETKVKEDLKATARGLAERRGARATQFAEDAIEYAKAASSSEALEMGLVDFVASDLDDLLHQLDGFRVSVGNADLTLHTTQADIKTISPSLIERLLKILTDPNIVFLLMNIGVMAVLIELATPGGWFAGFTGVTCLALATYGLGVLSVNWFGLIFLLVAFVLFILDIKAPSHGALTIAGVGSLIVGALVLFNSPGTPNFERVSVPLVVGASLATAAGFFLVVMIAMQVQKTPIITGQESLAGQVGVARSKIDPRGNVQVGSELWSAVLAEGATPISTDERVKVVRVEGVHLVVQKVE